MKPIFNKLTHTRQPVLLDIEKLIYEKIEKDTSSETFTTQKKGYIYSVKLAEGNRSVFLFCNSETYLHCGYKKLVYLKRASESTIRFFFNKQNHKDEIKIQLLIGKEHNIPYAENLKTLIEYNKKDAIFYELTHPIPVEDIKKLSKDELMTLVDLSLTDGVRKDPRLVYFYRPFLLGLNPSINPILTQKPRIIMASNPHSIIITSTKVGKSATGEKVGFVRERPTPANLLGFSTAQRGAKKEGELNNQTISQTIDDIGDSKEGDAIAQGLLNFMENGKAYVSRGYGNVTIGHCPLIFTSNPIRRKNEVSNIGLEALKLTEEILLKLHPLNPEALGSRIGLFLFFPRMEPADSSDILSDDEIEALDKFRSTYQEMLRSIFTRFFLNDEVKKWLSTQDPTIKNFQKKLKNLLTEFNIGEISWHVNNFLKGMISNYRHLKGFAFRQAVIDFSYDLICSEEIDCDIINKILKEADEHLKKTITVLIHPSLTNLLSTIEEDESKIVLFDLYYQNLDKYPKYEKVLVQSVAEYITKEQEEKNIFSLSSIKQEFLNVTAGIRRTLWFDSFNKFVDAIQKNLHLINYHSNDLGINLSEKDGIILVTVVKNLDWFNYIKSKNTSKAIKDNTENTENTEISTSGNDKNSGEIGEIGDKSIKATETDRQLLQGFTSVYKDHYKWALDLIKEDNLSYEFFERKFYEKFGVNFVPDEVEKLFDTIKELIKDGKK